MSRAVRRRGTALAALTAAIGLVAGVPAVSGGAAQSAEPTSDCAETFPVAELAEDQEVHGLTVSKGTTPEPFTGKVLGVLDDGIAAGLDMVIVELHNDAIDEVGGIWAGMSGSPVYAADGRLIGAVAYGLAYGPSPVAGVTPFDDMDDYLSEGVEARARVRVGERLAGVVAREAGVTEEQASRFDQLPMQLGVSGVSRKRYQQVQRADRDYLGRLDTHWTGAAGRADVDGSTVVAGGNIAAAVSYGDVTASGVGTATSVCDGRVVGFGHPMMFAGDTTLSLHPAEAIYIQEESLGAPFKVANLGAPAGTITDDRLTGITGGFGALPDTTTITSTVSMGARHRTGSTAVNLPAAGAEMTFSQHLANHDRVVDGVMAGSSLIDYTITGTDEAGKPFSLGYTDRFQSTFDITYDSAFDVADLVWGLTQIEGVSVDEVTMGSVVSKDRSAYTVAAVEQRRNGRWVTLGKGRPAVVKAGKVLRLRAVLEGASGTTHAKYAFRVPKRFHDRRGSVSVTGGNWTYSSAAYKSSVKKIARALAKQVRNDASRAELALSGARKAHVQRVVGPPVDRVVNGERRVRVVVR